MATAPRTGIADFYEREVLPRSCSGSIRPSPSSAGAATRTAGSPPTEYSRTPRSAPAPTASSATATHHAASSSTAKAPSSGRPTSTTATPPAAATSSTSCARSPSAPARPDQLDRPADGAERRANLLHDAFVLCRRELASDRGAPHAPTSRRAASPPTASPGRLGVMPEPTACGWRSQRRLPRTPRSPTRAPRRPALAGPHRRRLARRAQHITTLWARTTQDDAEKYLYLRGAPRPDGDPLRPLDLLAARIATPTATAPCRRRPRRPHPPRPRRRQRRGARRHRRTSALRTARRPRHQRVMLALDNDAAGRRHAPRDRRRRQSRPLTRHLGHRPRPLDTPRTPASSSEHRGRAGVGTSNGRTRLRHHGATPSNSPGPSRPGRPNPRRARLAEQPHGSRPSTLATRSNRPPRSTPSPTRSATTPRRSAAHSAPATGQTSQNEPSTRRASNVASRLGQATARPARHRIVPRHQELREIAGSAPRLIVRLGTAAGVGDTTRLGPMRVRHR